MVPEGWESGSSLRRKDYVGGVDVLHNKIVELRSRIVESLVKGGFDKQKVEALVERNVIGIRQPAKGGAPALYASPEAIDLLIINKKTDRVPLKAAPGWLSSKGLSDQFVGGNEDITTKLEQCKDALVQCLTENGFNIDEAASIIDHNLVGIRNSPRSDALYASADAVLMMEREEVIKRRTHSKSEARKPGRHNPHAR